MSRPTSLTALDLRVHLVCASVEQVDGLVLQLQSWPLSARPSLATRSQGTSSGGSTLSAAVFVNVGGFTAQAVRQRLRSPITNRLAAALRKRCGAYWFPSRRTCRRYAAKFRTNAPRMTKICAGDFSKQMQHSVANVTGALKDGLRNQLANKMDHMPERLFQNQKPARPGNGGKAVLSDFNGWPWRQGQLRNKRRNVSSKNKD